MTTRSHGGLVAAKTNVQQAGEIMTQLAEMEGRRWLTFEADLEYVAASAFRFLPSDASEQRLKQVYEQIVAGRTVDLSALRAAQNVMFG